jgi:hypothetical protein
MAVDKVVVTRYGTGTYRYVVNELLVFTKSNKKMYSTAHFITIQSPNAPRPVGLIIWLFQGPNFYLMFSSGGQGPGRFQTRGWPCQTTAG